MSGVFWEADEARLKTYSLSGGSASRTVVRIEIVISDEYAVASILRQLREIEQGQALDDQIAKAVAREAARRAKKTAGRMAPRELPAHPREHLLLTYRED